MKYFLIAFAILAIAGVLLFNKLDYRADLPDMDTNQFKIEEVIQATNYTYLRVETSLGENWVAVSKMQLKEGDSYYYAKPLEMTNFYSKDLQRTFDRILFISKISKTPIVQKEMTGTQKAHPHEGRNVIGFNTDSKIDKTSNELTVAQLYAKRNDLNGQKVSIRGKVIKLNKNIMNRNWIHIQDGTKNGKFYDLTVTSQQIPKMDEVISVQGTLSINKDFGSGYYYELILENAEIKTHL